MRIAGGGLGVGGIVIALIAYFLGFDPSAVMNLAEQVTPQAETQEAPQGAPADEMGQFVAKILGSTEDVWGQLLPQSKARHGLGPPTGLRYVFSPLALISVHSVPDCTTP